MALALIVAQARTGLPSHAKLEDAMFWVGALFAFTPIALGLGVLGYVWWSRTQRRRSGEEPKDREP